MSTLTAQALKKTKCFAKWANRLKNKDFSVSHQRGRSSMRTQLTFMFKRLRIDRCIRVVNRWWYMCSLQCTCPLWKSEMTLRYSGHYLDLICTIWRRCLPRVTQAFKSPPSYTSYYCSSDPSLHQWPRTLQRFHFFPACFFVHFNIAPYEVCVS